MVSQMQRLLLLSGAIGAGKSSIAHELKEKHFFMVLVVVTFFANTKNLYRPRIVGLAYKI